MSTTSSERKTPFEGVSTTPRPLTVKDDRAMATLAHFGGVVGCIPSAVIYLTLRARGRFTAQESFEALNFTLLPSIVIVVAAVLSPLPAIGWLFGLIAAVTWVFLAVMSLIAGMKVNRGNPYQYRFNPRPLERFRRDR